MCLKLAEVELVLNISTKGIRLGPGTTYESAPACPEHGVLINWHWHITRCWVLKVRTRTNSGPCGLVLGQHSEVTRSRGESQITHSGRFARCSSRSHGTGLVSVAPTWRGNVTPPGRS